MINLISYNKKAEIKAGRQNVTFLNLLFITVGSIVLVSILLGVAYAALVNGRDSASQRATASQKKIDGYSSQNAEITRYVSQLGIAKQVLSQQVNYSNIFLAIGSSLPKDAIVQELRIEPSNFDSSLSMTVYSRTKESMISVKKNMQAKPDIFADVQFQSVDFQKCSDSPDKPLDQTAYDCIATLKVVFNKKVKGIQ